MCYIICLPSFVQLFEQIFVFFALYVVIHLSNKGLPPLIVVLPALCAASCGSPAEIQLLCITGEPRGVPVHVIPLAAALLQHSGGVDHRHRQLATFFQAPAARLPPLHHRRVPAPVIRGETLEDDAHIHAGPGHGHHTQQGEDSLLATAKLPGFFQDVVKSGHGCRGDAGISLL